MQDLDEPTGRPGWVKRALLGVGLVGLLGASTWGLVKFLDQPAANCVAFEDSSNGLRAALAAGLATVITPNGFTAHHDFKGALRVVPDLGSVNVARLKEWHNR